MRENRAGIQRANRLAVVYAVALLGVYAILAAYARSAPGGTSPGATYGLEIFAAVAVLLAAAGVLLAFSSSPRRVELHGDATVLVGRLGGRLRLAALRDLDVRVVRRFRAGLLSSAPVEHVEIAPKGKGRRRAFLVEERLLEPIGTGLAPSPPTPAA